MSTFWGRRIFTKWLELGEDVPEEPLVPRALALLRGVNRQLADLPTLVTQGQQDDVVKKAAAVCVRLYALAYYYGVDLEDVIEGAVTSLEHTRKAPLNDLAVVPSPASLLGYPVQG